MDQAYDLSAVLLLLYFPPIKNQEITHDTCSICFILVFVFAFSRYQEFGSTNLQHKSNKWISKYGDAIERNKIAVWFQRMDQIINNEISCVKCLKKICHLLNWFIQWIWVHNRDISQRNIQWNAFIIDGKNADTD